MGVCSSHGGRCAPEVRARARGAVFAAAALVLGSSARGEACAWYDVPCLLAHGISAAEQAAKKGAETVVSASRGDFDAVANNVIDQVSNPYGQLGPFRQELLKNVNQLAPAQVRSYVDGAVAVNKQLETGATSLRAQTYKNLYSAYKNDGNTIFTRLKEGNYDFREYYKYSFYYAVATADWSNPDAVKASAARIAWDQYTAYSWYGSHTIRGAAIGTARDRVGLTDDAIKGGVTELSGIQKDDRAIGVVGALIATEFVLAGKQAQCDVNGDYCSTGGPCNQYSMQHTMSIRNSTGERVPILMHVLCPGNRCSNHVTDVNGIFEPGQSRMGQVFGCNADNQVKVNVSAYEPGTDLLAATLAFDKAAGNSVNVRRGWKNRLCVEVGDTHGHGCEKDPVDPHHTYWVSINTNKNDLALVQGRRYTFWSPDCVQPPDSNADSTCTLGPVAGSLTRECRIAVPFGDNPWGCHLSVRGVPATDPPEITWRIGDANSSQVHLYQRANNSVCVDNGSFHSNTCR